MTEENKANKKEEKSIQTEIEQDKQEQDNFKGNTGKTDKKESPAKQSKKNTAKKKVVSEDSKAKEISNKFAIIETGGKQYKVAKDTIIDVEKLNVEPNQTIQFDTVLLLSDQTKLNIGTPYIEGAKVKAKVLEHIKAKKEVVFKFKRKTGYKKTQGHRQKLTRLHIQSI